MKFLQILPHKIALAFGKFVGKILHLVLWRKVDRCEARCVKSLGVGVTIAREIIRSSFINLGMSAVEFIRLPVMKKNIESLVSFPKESEDFLRSALSRGHGAILMCTHTANWESTAARVIHAGFDLHAVYTKQRGAANEIISQIRADFGMKMIDSDTGLREIFRTLKNHGIVVIMQDLDARKDGIITNFLGMPASTHEGIIKLYNKFKCPIIPSRYTRDKNNPAHISLTMNEIISDKPDKNGRPFGEDLYASIELCNSVIENWIRETPEQWLWLLDKWQYTLGKKI